MSDNDLKEKISELQHDVMKLESQIMTLDQAGVIEESQSNITSILNQFKKDLTELMAIASTYVRNNYSGFRQAIEQNLEGIMILNPEGEILFANPTVKQWFSHYGEILGEKIGIPLLGAEQRGEVNIL